MQTDGNFCLYPTDGSNIWCSGTAGHPGAYLIVQDDGHIQIIDGAACYGAGRLYAALEIGCPVTNVKLYKMLKLMLYCLPANHDV